MYNRRVREVKNMKGVSVNFEGLTYYVTNEELEQIKPQILVAHDAIENRTGAGRSMLGWKDLPESIKEDEIKKINEAADKIRANSQVLVVIGTGGSYLGARAVIEMLSDSLYNLQSDTKRKGPQVLFVGNNLSGKYMRSVVEYIEDKDVTVNVISKSGTTLEPAIAFRILKLFMEEKYGKGGAAERIFVTTDAEKGVLKQIADKEGYETFVIPHDVGGRYSVLSPVGLLPIAVAGIDIEDLIDGALFARHMFNVRKAEDNDCYKYAAMRNILHSKGKDIEIMSSYEPSMQYFIEWYKQLFGESEGKDGKGIFPAGVTFTADLHSMGQLIQDGKRNIFETVLNIELDKSFIRVPEVVGSMDGLDYIANKPLEDINKVAEKATCMAHMEGGVPIIEINVKELTPYNVGQLIFFFEKACAISGYVLGVNPFDQPGVEEYKKRMKQMLNKEEDLI